MNKLLIQKLLKKVSLKELFDEIREEDDLVFALGTIIAQKQRDLFLRLIRSIVQEVIASQDAKLCEFLKTEILNMDGKEKFSVNEVSRKRVSTSEVNPCVSGVRNTRC